VQTILIAGVGLIGGSFGLALRRAGFSGRILGVSSPATIEKAKTRGAIDGGCSMEAAAEADLIFLAQPVGVILDTIPRLRPKPGALVTDAGSTKQRIVASMEEHLPAGSFVGGHPMAGKAARGIDSAAADLFAGRTWILTTPVPQGAAELRTWIEKTGARVVEMSPWKHDEAVALTSHLPQLLSTALAAALAGKANLDAAGSGLESMTRLAASDFALWRDILLTNREAIRGALGQFRNAFDEVEAALDSGDLRELFAAANAFAARVNPKPE
jgi:prephenate dehydrogenase